MIEISRDAPNCAVRSHELFLDIPGVFESEIESQGGIETAFSRVSK